MQRLFLILAGLALLSGCGDSHASKKAARKNVILICLDTVRADHLGCYGYDRHPTTPWMDQLAGGATVFDDCSATACWTKPSVPSYMTGTYPLQHGVYRGSARSAAGSFSDVLTDDANTVAEVFRGAGYQTGAYVKNAQLRRGMGFEQGFERYVDKAGDAREIRWQAQDWLDECDPERPFFLYLHFLDAHWPYPVPDDYAAMFADAEKVEEIRSSDWRQLRDEVNSGRRKLTPEEVATLRGLYDGALRYLDDQLSRLHDHLERSGVAEDTIICIVSDHGEEFGEHGKIGHGHGLYENLLQVPWILSIPGEPAQRISTPVSLVDLYPTLLGAADLEGGRVQGVDRRKFPDVDRPVFAEHLDPGRYHQSVRLRRNKTMRVIRPDRPQAEARASREALDSGGRWEARVRLDEAGELLATRLRPAATQSRKPPEWKGPIEAREGDEFVLFGQRVRLLEDTELYGDLVGDRDLLQPGLLVKARGRIESGVMLAEKVKLYPEGTEVEVEVRGWLERDGEHSVSLSGLAVLMDGQTEIDLESDSSDLTREDVLRVVSLGLEATGWMEQHFDLKADPGELSETGVRRSVEASSLQSWLEELLSDRRWGDTRTLDESEMADLRAIGYAD